MSDSFQNEASKAYIHLRSGLYNGSEQNKVELPLKRQVTDNFRNAAKPQRLSEREKTDVNTHHANNRLSEFSPSVKLTAENILANSTVKAPPVLRYAPCTGSQVKSLPEIIIPEPCELGFSNPDRIPPPCDRKRDDVRFLSVQHFTQPPIFCDMSDAVTNITDPGDVRLAFYLRHDAKKVVLEDTGNSPGFFRVPLFTVPHFLVEGIFSGCRKQQRNKEYQA
ncbi:type VI secretion system contractile sheath small subunit [Enterobacteriaceae bacterium LUAb1]